jgi:hypothetical protein
MKLNDFFESVQTTKPTHNWTLNSHKFMDISSDDLSLTLAREIVNFRCRRCAHHFNAWKDKVYNDIPLCESSQKALHAFLTPTFGEPNEYFNGAKIDHLEGYIGEWLWYFLFLENPCEPIVYTIPPGFKSTDPGGDAVTIHRNSNNEFLFRLWEMKKFSPRSTESSQRISGTVNKAYSQLNTKATEYLARVTATEHELENPELEVFVGKLLDLWIDASYQASAGVSIATSLEHVSQNCFDDFGGQFPNFVDPIRLQGILTGIDDFSRFAIKVQEVVWKGL